MIETVKNHIKNFRGWKTKRKLIAIVVDDYGNVRVDSKKALENIQKKNINKPTRFDLFDSLETKEDLEKLYEVLESVKDQFGNSAKYTPYSLPCNIDFERMKNDNYEAFYYEYLPDTYEKLSSYQPKAYEGTWKLWQEGIKKGLMKPEFHGREHLNLKVFNEMLTKKDSTLMLSLENRSLANIGHSSYSSIRWPSAFAFWDPIDDTKSFPEIINTGVLAFEKVYGYRSIVFTPPARNFPEHLEKRLKKWGFRAFDRPYYQKKHIGFGKYKHEFSKMGYNKNLKMVDLVRNVVFEPTESAINHVAKALAQIEAAFVWNKPAIISSHRVNFCGHIDPYNRTKGLGDLKTLLKAIEKKWPEVEFVSASQLVDLISDEYL